MCTDSYSGGESFTALAMPAFHREPAPDFHGTLQGVAAEARGSFSSIEAAWQNLFEICSYVSTIVFSRPDQFKWPALISVIAVGFAGLLYAIFVRIQRGHLVHLPKCIAPERLQCSRERGLDRIFSASDF